MALPKVDLKLPSVGFVLKSVISVALIMFLVRMSPDTWGIKKYFQPFKTA